MLTVEDICFLLAIVTLFGAFSDSTSKMADGSSGGISPHISVPFLTVVSLIFGSMGFLAGNHPELKMVDLFLMLFNLK